MLPSEERTGRTLPIDPAKPGDGGAGGITTPEGSEAGETKEPHGSKRPQKEIEVGEPRDGP